jgi:hypothetical protein
MSLLLRQRFPLQEHVLTYFLWVNFDRVESQSVTDPVKGRVASSSQGPLL